MGHRDTTVSVAHAFRPLLAHRTNRFLVDELSDLYYDPSPLRQHEKEAKSTEEGVEKTERPSVPPHDRMVTDSPQLRRTHSTAAPMPFSPRHQGPYPQNMGFNNMSRVPSAQFYGNGDPGVPSPMRMASIGMPMGDVSGMGGMPIGGMGGMGPMNMASPDTRRAGLRRGISMGEDNFGMGGMH